MAGRLRRVLELSGLAMFTMGSGPCCATETDHACHTIDELVELRDRVLQDRDAKGAGGAGGANGAGGLSVGRSRGDGGGSSHLAGQANAAGRGGADAYACVDAADQCAEGDPDTREDVSSGGSGADGRRYVDWKEERVHAWDPSTGCPSPDQYGAMLALDHQRRWDAIELTEDGDRCCYRRDFFCRGGRPFLVGATARVASLASVDPTETAQDVEGLLAEAWADDGLFEHASVAAFARLTLQLMALGAPSSLIEASQRASLDELEHAAFCFSRAAHHAASHHAASHHADGPGEPPRPGPLDVRGALDDVSWESLLRANVLEGCIGETLAAVRVGEQARLATDPALQAALRKVAEDEARHADLAWQILAWSLDVAPERARDVLQRTLDGAIRDRPPEAATSAPSWARTSSAAARWAAAGRLTAAQGEALDDITWERVLAPLFRDVLQRPSPRPTDPAERRSVRHRQERRPSGPNHLPGA